MFVEVRYIFQLSHENKFTIPVKVKCSLVKTMLMNTIPMLLNLKNYLPPTRGFQFWLNVAFDIETSHMFCYAKQMTGFHMKCNSGLN